MLDSVSLVPMNGRVYDPEIGRFMSVDPVFQFPENLQSLNPYSYVLNNPLSLTDPTGHFVFVAVPIATAAYNAYSALSAAADAAVVLTDKTASPEQKAMAVAEAVAGVIDPTPGDLGKRAMTAARQGIKAAEKGAGDAAKAAKKAEKPAADKAASPASANGADAGQGVKPSSDSPGNAPAKRENAQSESAQVQQNREQGLAGEARTREKLGDDKGGEQVTLVSSDGEARARIDFIKKDGTLVETKTGNGDLTPGQKKIMTDVNEGRLVTPVGERAREAGLTPGQPVKLKKFEVDRQ